MTTTTGNIFASTIQVTDFLQGQQQMYWIQEKVTVIIKNIREKRIKFKIVGQMNKNIINLAVAPATTILPLE